MTGNSYIFLGIGLLILGTIAYLAIIILLKRQKNK